MVDSAGASSISGIRRGGEGNSRVMNVRWREEAGQGEDDDEDESPGLK